MNTVLFSIAESAACLEILLTRCLGAPMPRDKSAKDFVYSIVTKTLAIMLGVASQSEYEQSTYIETQRLLRNQIMEYASLDPNKADEVFLDLETSLLHELQVVLPFLDELPVIIEDWRVSELYDVMLKYYVNI